MRQSLMRALLGALVITGFGGSLPRSLGSSAWLSPAVAQIRQSSQLAVQVNGLRNRQGEVCLSLFATSRGFPGNGADALQRKCMAITAHSQRVLFENLQPGSYAVAVLHDANSDREINRNFLGIPIEGFGFSRNPVIRTGPPTFSEAVVLVAGQMTNIQVQLSYF